MDSNAVMHIISKNVRNRVVGHGAVIVMDTWYGGLRRCVRMCVCIDF